MTPRLTDAEADDLAVKALMAMAVDDYRTDLRARVKSMRYTLVAGSRVVFVDDVLDLIDIHPD